MHGGLSCCFDAFTDLFPRIEASLAELGDAAPLVSLLRFEHDTYQGIRVNAERLCNLVTQNLVQQGAVASRSKNRFFAATSHDLRQPLHALGLFAAALAAKVRDPEAVHMVASVNASAEALEQLFNEILDISKIDSGVIQPNIDDVPAERVLARLRHDFTPEAAEKRLRLSVRHCADYLRTDPVLLERILRNLVGNALCYTERGGVVVGCRRRGDHVVFEIIESGIGIAEAERQHVFDEFYQVGNPERSSKRGLGLGPSIVRRLCDLFGHEIELASWPGRGTRFRLRVPVGAQPAPVTPPRAQLAPPQRHCRPPHRCHRR